MAKQKNIKCDKSCKNCKYPCVNNGENYVKNIQKMNFKHLFFEVSYER